MNSAKLQIQGQYKRINCMLATKITKWKIVKYNIKVYQILTNKSSERHTRPLHWKLLNITKRNELNGGVYYIYRLENAAYVNFPKLIYRFNEVALKILLDFF